MTVRAIRVALLLSLLPTAGCGTVANLAHTRPEEGGRVPFGGVKRDVATLHKAGGGEPGAGAHHKPDAEAEQYQRTAFVFLCAVDLPLSLIGDLLTWPYTAAYSIVNAPVPVPPLVLMDAPAARPVALPAPAPVTKPMPIPIPPAFPPDALPKPEKRP